MSERKLRRRGRLAARDGNPLRRRIDRIEAAVLTGLLLAFLIAAPVLAIFAVRTAGDVGSRELRAQRSWREVPAVLQQGAQDGRLGLSGDWNVAWVTARWTAPSGARRSGLVPVGLHAGAGQRLTIWVTGAGQLTHPPLSAANVRVWRLLAGALVPAALAVLLASAAGLIRLLVNRRRLAGWSQAWTTVGPQWSARR